MGQQADRSGLEMACHANGVATIVGQQRDWVVDALPNIYEIKIILNSLIMIPRFFQCFLLPLKGLLKMLL